MKPLTLDCARVRQLIDAYHDDELGPDERAFVEGHLTDCSGCAEAWQELQGALFALSHLTRDDLDLLRGLPGDPELDARPLTHLLVGGLVLLLLVLGVAAYFTVEGPRRAAPPPEPQVVRAPLGFPLPAVGAVVGVERELVAARARPPARAAAVPAPEPIPLDVELAAAAPEPAPAQPPVRVAPPPAPAADEPPPQPPAPVPVVVEKPALPEGIQACLERYQLSLGLSYQELSFFFVRDPEGRDRLSSARPPGLPTVRETSPAGPERAALRPGRGRGLTLLFGELLDAPLGLRVATGTQRLVRRTDLDVVAVRWDGLARTHNRAPLLKGRVLLPSQARFALLTDAQPGPVALFLEALTDRNITDEIRRLQLDLSRLESETRDLERRLRARIRGTRGLRGVALSINGSPRSIELFGSAREFSAAFPVLLRTALLEARLENELGPQDEWVADPRERRILGSITMTREEHRALLAAWVEARQEELERPLREVDARFDLSTEGFAGRLYLNEAQLVHGLLLVKQ